MCMERVGQGSDDKVQPSSYKRTRSNFRLVPLVSIPVIAIGKPLQPLKYAEQVQIRMPLSSFS